MKEIYLGGNVFNFGAVNGKWFRDNRICLSVLYFDQESDAILIDKAVRKSGASYNGGWFHGMPCGREPARDYIDKDGIEWYAVTC